MSNKGLQGLSKLLLVVMGVLAVNPVPAFADSFGWDDEGGSSKTEQSQEASSDFLKGFDEFMSAKDGNYKASEDVSYNTQKSTAVHYASDSYHPQNGFDISHGGNAVRYYENGQMKKGWVDNGVWYHFNDTDGTMDRNKWVEDNGKWYYMGANGMMARNVYVDGYYLNNSGEITDDVPARALAKKPTYTRVAGVINSGVVSMSIEEFNKGVDNGTIQPVITHPNGKVSFDWKYVG